MEKLVEKTTEVVIEKPQTPIVAFWERLEKNVGVESAEKEKLETKIAEFWNSFEEKSQIESYDKDSSENYPESIKLLIEKYHKEYIEYLKANSEYPETIEDDGSEYKKISPEENAKKRAEFNANKEKLIKEWEVKYGSEWPRYKEDVYVNGKLQRRAGDRYDVHHIKPLSFGGKNEASNITPISAEKHFDKQGVHSTDSPYGKLDKLLREE